MNNKKKYNIFIFCSSFARAMVELFIPINIYNYRNSFKDVLLFYIIMYSATVLIIPFIKKLSKKMKYRSIIIISNIFFVTSVILFYKVNLNISNIIITSILYSAYLIFYWMGRHYYALIITDNKKVTNNVSSFTIVNILALIPSVYFGAFLIKKEMLIMYIFIIILLELLGVLPLFFIKEKMIQHKQSLKKIVSSFPIKNYLFIIFEQFKFITILLFPLYVFLYVSKKLEYIGILNLLINISSIFSIYFLSKKMDKNRKDYLLFTSLLLALFWFLKIIIRGEYLFLIIVLLEGIFRFNLEMITLRNIYSYGKGYNANNYIYFIELLRNGSRAVILLLLFVFNINIKIIIYLGIISLLINGIIKFYDGKYGYKKN